MRMTIRECIREMRKIKISDAQTIWTENGTEINIPDIKRSLENSTSRIKIVNGEQIIRVADCFIVPSKNTKCLDTISKYNLYEKFGSYPWGFRKNEYYIPEKELNIFISINGGIDKYRSIDAYLFLIWDMEYVFGI